MRSFYGCDPGTPMGPFAVNVVKRWGYETYEGKLEVAKQKQKLEVVANVLNKSPDEIAELLHNLEMGPNVERQQATTFLHNHRYMHPLRRYLDKQFEFGVKCHKCKKYVSRTDQSKAGNGNGKKAGAGTEGTNELHAHTTKVSFEQTGRWLEDDLHGGGLLRDVTDYCTEMNSTNHQWYNTVPWRMQMRCPHCPAETKTKINFGFNQQTQVMFDMVEPTEFGILENLKLPPNDQCRLCSGHHFTICCNQSCFYCGETGHVSKPIKLMSKPSRPFHNPSIRKQ